MRATAEPIGPGGDGTGAQPAAADWLWPAALLVLLPALAFAVRYPLLGNTDRLVDIGKLAAYGRTEFAGYLGGVAAMFAGYVWGIRLCGRLPARRALPVVFGGGALAAAAMAWMYPVNAIDLFIYAVRSRIFTAHGTDPMAVAPVAFPTDPLMQLASREWGGTVSPYGPLWTLLAAPFTALAGDRFGLALAGLKLLAVAATLVGGWIIARAVALDAPERSAQAALLYLWNPLVLWEGIGNAHNDVVMMVPVLLAFLWWKGRRNALVIPALLVAATIKYVALTLLPLAAVALWRRRSLPDAADRSPAVAFGRGSGEPPPRARVFALAAALSVLVLLVAFAPFYDVAAVRGSLSEQGSLALTSPAAVAIGLLAHAAPALDARAWVRAASVAVFGLGLVVALAAVWRRPERLPRAAFETTFLLLLVAIWNFRPWYLIWLVALAALLPPSWPAARTIAWTAGGLAGYALFIWGWEWWKVPWADVQVAGVLLMTGPATLLTLAELVRPGRAGDGGRGTSSRPEPVERWGEWPTIERRSG